VTTDEQEIETEAARWFGIHDRGPTPAQNEELAAWLAADGRHRKAFCMFQEASRSFDQLSALRPLGEPDPDLVLRPALWSRRWIRIALPLAAAAAVLFGYFLGWRPAHSSGTRFKFSESVATDVGQLRTLSLPDGSQVELSTNTALVATFDPAERRIRLARGEAHFSVAKDPGRPFAVEAGGVAVLAVGTAFDVRLRSEAVEVLVTEGKVRVDDAVKGGSLLPPLNTAPAASGISATGGTEAMLGAGQRAVIPIGQTQPSDPSPSVAAIVAPVAPAQIARLLGWQQKRLYFDPTPLSEVVLEFNRFNRQKLVLADAATGAVRVGGSFQADDGETFVRLLESSFGITAERRDGEIVLRLPH